MQKQVKGGQILVCAFPEEGGIFKKMDFFTLGFVSFCY